MSIEIFTKKWEIFWKTFSQPVWYEKILEGLQNTVLIAVIGLLIGIVIGSLIAIIKLLPQYKLAPKIGAKICDVYVGLFRGTPIVVQLLLGWYVLLPLLGIKGADNLTACIVIFGLNSAAYVSEIMRGGILSVDVGQMEASRALGLTHGKGMVRVVLPQAFKNIMPTLGNEFITLIKETSVVSFVGAFDLYTVFSLIGSKNYDVMIPYLVMALFYIVLVVFITILIKLLEKGLRKSEKH